MRITPVTHTCVFEMGALQVAAQAAVEAAWGAQGGWLRAMADKVGSEAAGGGSSKLGFAGVCGMRKRGEGRGSRGGLFRG